jgi:hypothetical protein
MNKLQENLITSTIPIQPTAQSGWLSNRTTGKAFQTEPKPKLKAGQIAGRFVESGKRRESSAKRAWPSLQRALRSMKRPAFYSLGLSKHMGLNERHEVPDGLFKPAVIELIRDNLKKAFTGTFYFTIEVGLNGRLHAHVVACVDSCLLDLPDDGETCKPIAKGTEFKVLRYLHKPAPQDESLIQAHAKAMKRYGGKLPNVRGFVRLERVQTAKKRAMWIKPGWKRTRKAIQDGAASKVRLRPMRKPKSNYDDFYKDSPTTSYDVCAFLGIDPQTKRKRKRYTAHVEPLRA